MFPPVALAVLDANPLFADLYVQLTTRILDPVDASTRANSRPNDTLDQVPFLLPESRPGEVLSLFGLGTAHAPGGARKDADAAEGAGGADEPGPRAV